MKKLLSIFVLALLTALLSAQVSKTVNVTNAGKFGTLLTANEKTTVTNLTITGNFDARDVKCLRDSMPLLAVLDISAVSFQPYNGTAGTNGNTSTSYPANEMPTYSFYNNITNKSKTSLTTITLPTTLTSIGDYAFEFCSGITGTLTLPTTITSIGDYAFVGCSGITGSLIIPATLTSIGTSFFINCNIMEFIVDVNNLNYSSKDGVLFNKDKTILIRFPAAKAGNYLVPNTVTIIGVSAFQSCSNITGVTLPNGLISIQDYAFHYCKIGGELILPSSLTSIGRFAFYYCTNITGSLVFPIGVTNIAYSTFESCSSINGLTFSSGLTNIDSYAFYNCSGIKLINSLNISPPTLGNQCFYAVSSVSDVFVPTDPAVTSYKANTDWFGYFPGDIIKKATTSSISNLTNSNVKVYGTNSEIIVDGTSEGETVTLYTVNGRQIQTVMSKGERLNLSVDRDAVYLVKTGEKTFKVIL